MAVVIRLQGLPIVAGTMDIRHFFSGLTIPDGGVHIVGGDHGEAFIVFATDEDARLGMMRTGGAIKGAKVSLLLSSKTEMQNMIELSRRRFESGPPEAPPTGTRSTAAAPPTAAPSAPPRSAQFNAPAAGAQFNTATASGQFNTSAAAAQFATPTAAAQFATPAAAAQFATPAAVAQFATPTAGAQFATPTAATPFATPTAAAAFATPTAADTKAPPNMAPTFPSYSSAPTLTTALASLTPPLAALPNMAALPPMPSLPPPAVPPVPPMSHLQHMALPPFNPALPPPLGGANPLLFNPLAPLPLGLPHMKAPPLDDLIVALQNLPYAACEPDVHDFFRGLSVQSVRFVRDGQGRKTGRALAKFFSPQDSYEALKRGGGSVGQRYVEVSPASERQWNSLEQKEAEPERGRSQSSSTAEQRGRSRSPQRQDLCVYLKGLPYEADKAQVKDFFKNLALDEDSLYIAYGANGKATGEGFVEFKNEADYKSALAAHMQYMGARFIQVHPISRRGMVDKIEQIRKRDTEAPDSAHRTPKTCLHITNIPYNVSRKDVRAFLEGLALFEDSLNVLSDAHGNGLGQAVVQLTSEEEAKKAERLHRQKLNGRDAFVHLVTVEHMKEVERNPPPQNKRGQRQAPPPAHMAPPSHMAPPPAHFGPINDDFSFIRNPSPFAPPFSAPGNGLAPPPIPPLGPGLGMSELGMTELGVPPPLVPGMAAPVMDPPGFRPGGAGPPFGHDLRGAVPFERKTPSRSNGAPRPLGGTPPPAFPPDPALRGAPPPAAGANGGGPTVVKLQNMPFTVSADEIMDFLYGYAVAPGSVCLQFNDKGLPNGEAMVAFESAEEAAAAVHDLNERPIGNRKVKMSLG